MERIQGDYLANRHSLGVRGVAVPYSPKGGVIAVDTEEITAAADTGSGDGLTCVDSSADLLGVEKLDKWRFRRPERPYFLSRLAICKLSEDLMIHFKDVS